uniref:ATP-dependent RNA helicase n=1 Tax=Heterorhabditis bacteriophora TaxID=37862 RepID=A0A1I7WY93_HETBA
MVVKKIIKETTERAQTCQAPNTRKRGKSNGETSLQRAEFLKNNGDEFVDSFSGWNENDGSEEDLSSNGEHQKEFKVLGQKEFKSFSKITFSNLYAIIIIIFLNFRCIILIHYLGSGKTLCYVLPILAAIGERSTGRLIALIVVPVQTLVHQIEKEFLRYNSCYARVSSLSGATDFEKELHNLNKDGSCRSDVIIATPGRLMEHLTDPRNKIQLNTLRFLVVDEADRMGHMVRTEWLELVERRAGVCIDVLYDLILYFLFKNSFKLELIVFFFKLTIKNKRSVIVNFTLFILYSYSFVKNFFQLTLDMSDSLTLPSTIQHTVLSIEQNYHPLLIYSYIEKYSWQKVLVFTNEKESSLRLSRLLSRLADEKYKVYISYIIIIIIIHISPTGKLPLLRLLYFFYPFYNFCFCFPLIILKGVQLSAHLTDVQMAEMRAHMSVIELLLRNIEVYSEFNYLLYFLYLV